MAYVGYSIIHVSSKHNSLKDAIEYVTDRNHDFKKTSSAPASDIDKILNTDEEEQVYIHSDGCSFLTAEAEWLNTLKNAPHYNVTHNEGKKEVLAYHIWQSFKEGEVTAEQAHEIGKEYAEKLLGGKYQYIVCTHLDKENYHNHIIFCAVDKVKHRKFKYKPVGFSDSTINHWRRVSDEVCKAHGLDIINDEYIDEEHRSKKNAKYKNTKYEKNGSGKRRTNRDKLRADIDEVLKTADTYDEFLEAMCRLGYEVRTEGKYTAFKYKDWERYARLNKTLGEDYTEEAIRERIITKRPHIPKRMRKRRISLIIDIETNIKCQASEAYSNWAKIHNLQEASKTLNFLIENDIGSYEEMDSKVKELKAEKYILGKRMEPMDAEIADLKRRIAMLDEYHAVKYVPKEYKKAKNKAQFQREHAIDGVRYNRIIEALKKEYPEGRLPSEKELKAKLEKLLKERQELYERYKDIDDEIRTYEAAKSNIDRFMGCEKKKPEPERNTAEEQANEQAHSQARHEQEEQQTVRRRRSRNGFEL